MSNLLSLFTGYGGLDMAVMALTGAELVAVSDIDKGPCAVLAHYHPDVPNLGDIKAIEWESADVPEFDVLTGGYPCQPFSEAGHRKGTDDPRHLWPYVLKAIEARRPQHVYLENVRGHLTLGFDIVLNDLASAGYNVHWSIMAASSVGAAHRRERLYIYATPSPDGAAYTPELPEKLPVAGHLTSDGLVALTRVDEHLHTVTALLPTPLARDHRGTSAANRQGGLSLGDVARLFPTPKYNDGVMGRPRTKGRPIEKSTHLGTIVTLLPSATSVMFPTPVASDNTGARKTRPNGYKALKDMPLLLEKAGARLMPTPNTMDNLPVREGEALERQLRRGEGANASRRATVGNLREDILLTVEPDRYDDANSKVDKREQAPEWQPFNINEWGVYAEAVARWTITTGNLPPAPVQPNRNGNPQLTAAFPAWLMGLPNGYLTNPELGLTRTDIIKMAGNGVVPQAALVAYTHIHQRVDTLHVQ